MKFFKFLLPLLVIGGAIAAGKYLVETGPEAKKKPFVERLPVVEVIKLKSQSYTVSLKASGIVRAGTQTNLVSEVSGRILNISDSFNEGSYFKAGQTLLTIDDANYKNAIAISSSDVAGNRALLSQLLAEEKSSKRAYHLATNNLRLGRAELGRKQNLWKKKLIARSVVDAEAQKQNQLQQKVEELQGRLNTYHSRRLAIDAKINAAQSRQKQDRLNLSRTAIKTPYAGRVLQKSVDVGQYVGKGTMLGKIYATDFVTVDLPLSLNQYELLGIPESFQNKVVSNDKLPEVIFSSTNSRKKSTWKGKVVRTSAALDADSRQIKLIAKIDKPFIAKANVSAPVRIGQYLDATIKGKTLHDVFVLSAGSVRQNKEVLLLKDGKVHIVGVDVLVNTSKETVLIPREDIAGLALITTSMNQATEGMKVITLAQQKEKLEKRRKAKQKLKLDKALQPSKGSN